MLLQSINQSEAITILRLLPATSCLTPFSPVAFFSRPWYWWHFFDAFGTSYMFFPRLAPVACFSRAWHRLHDFPAFGTGVISLMRLAPFTCFSRAWHRLHDFPAFGTGVISLMRLAPFTCFSRVWHRCHFSNALGTDCMFFPRLAGVIFWRFWRQLHVTGKKILKFEILGFFSLSLGLKQLG